jgi:hypothetical protein
MDNPADTLDQTDEDILTYTASDEALELAAAGGLGGGGFAPIPETSALGWMMRHWRLQRAWGAVILL